MCAGLVSGKSTTIMYYTNRNNYTSVVLCLFWTIESKSQMISYLVVIKSGIVNPKCTRMYKGLEISYCKNLYQRHQIGSEIRTSHIQYMFVKLISTPCPATEHDWFAALVVSLRARFDDDVPVQVFHVFITRPFVMIPYIYLQHKPPRNLK